MSQDIINVKEELCHTLLCLCALAVCLCNKDGEKRESFPSELSSSIISGSLPLMMMTQLKGGVQTYMLCVCDSYRVTNRLTPWKEFSSFLFYLPSPPVAAFFPSVQPRW